MDPVHAAVNLSTDFLMENKSEILENSWIPGILQKHPNFSKIIF
jgi:hypothetical protein